VTVKYNKRSEEGLPVPPPDHLTEDQKALWRIGELLRLSSAGNPSLRAKVLTIVQARFAAGEKLDPAGLDRAVEAANEATAAGLDPHEQLVHGLRAYLGLEPDAGAV
jgi:hypothetical protein